MEKIICDYLSITYIVDVDLNDVMRERDKKITYLDELKWELVDVFGITNDEAYMYVTIWAVKNGLTDLKSNWDITIVSPSEAGFVYAPYIPLMTAEPIDTSYANLLVNSIYSAVNVSSDFYGSISFSGIASTP